MSEFKYEIGEVVGNYTIIKQDYELKKCRGKLQKTRQYTLRCNKCGYEINRREYDVTEEKLSRHRCKGCISNTTLYSAYKIGDIVNGSIVIDIFKRSRSNGKSKTVKVNCYKMKCLRHDYEYEVEQSNLISGSGCPICGHNKVVVGINDIATIAPWMISLFNDPLEAEGKSPGSEYKAIFKCPNCGELTRPLHIYTIYRLRHVPCGKCGDGFPITEKFLYNILRNNNIDFEYQKEFDWSNNKIYDFYLKDYNTIIEVNGGQHYYLNENSFWGDVESIQTNDKFKKEIAIPHVKNYIVIDCRKSDYNFLLKQYMEALSDIIDTHQNYYQEYINSLKSKIIEVHQLWEQNYSIKEIVNLQQISESTVRNYLRRLKKLKLLKRPYGFSNK